MLLGSDFAGFSMRSSASAAGCITFCLVGNHSHLLLSVPTERASLSAMSDAEWVRRCSHIYGKVDDGVAIGSRAFLEEVFRKPSRKPWSEPEGGSASDAWSGLGTLGPESD
jgi:hypothetical protein